MKWPWQPKPAEPETLPPIPEPPDNADKQPNWERILTSDLWKEDLAPALYAQRQTVLEKMLTVKSWEDFRALQGEAVAITRILMEPAAVLAWQKRRDAQIALIEEQKENERRGIGVVERFGRKSRA